MLEIKFRGKDLETKEWRYGYYACILGQHKIINSSGQEYFVDGETVGQYVGLEDRNKVEIYSGELIKVLDRDWPSQLDSCPELNHQQYLDSISSYCEVIWKNCSFYLEQRKGYGYYSPPLSGVYGRDVFEIIGNVTDNPELLTQ